MEILWERKGGGTYRLCRGSKNLIDLSNLYFLFCVHNCVEFGYFVANCQLVNHFTFAGMRELARFLGIK